MQSRTETEILSEMVGYANEVGLITTDSSLISRLQNGEITENQYVLMLSVFARMNGVLDGAIVDIDQNVNIDTARGEALDHMGKLLNVTRYPSQPAMVDITISTAVSLEEDVIIPAGSSLRIDEVSAGLGSYITSEAVTLSVGSSSVSVAAECTELGFRTPLPAGSVVGLTDFPSLTVTNEGMGSTGRWIEEDDNYRQRILGWASKNTRGTRACLDDYLLNYPGLSRYKLIPLYDGVGTLKIVCDAISSAISTLATDVYTNCMLVTDSQPVVVQPTVQELDTLTVHVSIDWSKIKISVDQLSDLLDAQIRTYVTGGTCRDGSSFVGISMGSDLNPSLLWKFVLDQFPEVSNIYATGFDSVVDVDDDKKLTVNNVVIVYDNVASL